MADEVEVFEVPAKCLTQMADIVEYILRFASGKSLESAVSVCTLWRDIIKRIRKTRRDCVILPQTVTFDKFGSHKPSFDFSHSLSSVATEPQAALLFTYLSSASAPIPPYIKDNSKYLKINQASLPRRCVLVGCGTSGVYYSAKTQSSSFSKNNLLPIEGTNTLNAMVLFPRAPGVHVGSFHLPLRNKYKSISGLDSFLPVMEEPVKLVIVLAHPLSLGKLTNFAVKVKKKYGGKTVIAGCYSDCVLFHQSTVTFREIVGLVFAGDLISASIVIHGSSENEIIENLHKGLVRLKSTQIPMENAMALMFRPPAQQHIDGNIKCRAFQHHFPGVPVIGVDGSAIYGCDTVELERSARQAGGRDFLHTQSTLVCMFSLSTKRNQKDMLTSSVDTPITVDDVMEKIGSFGRYQARLFVIMGFMKIFGDGFQIMIPTFLAAEPPWQCVENSTACNVTGTISPENEFYKHRCRLPRSEWEFDTSEFTSIVSEWDLVCDRSSLTSLSKSVVFAGYLIGVLFGGLLSDKFGRKPIVYFLSVLCNVLALIASFVNAFWAFTLLRALVGICIGSSSMSMFVLLVEYVNPKNRAAIGTSLWYFWTVSLMLLALFAWVFKADWRVLSIAGAAPGLLQVFFWWFLPESFRWLMVNNKTKQGKKYLCEVAKLNRRVMPSNPIVVVTTKQRVGDFRDLFRSFKMAHTTLVSWLCWVVISMIYYGVTFSSGDFGGNRYLVFFLTSLVEIPSHFTAIVLMNRIGRKKTTFLGLIVASLASTCAVLLQRDNSEKGFLVGRIIMAMTAKFFISMSFDTIYIFSAELFPTVVRNFGLGSSSAAARIGSITAPFVVWLVRIHLLLPYSIFAVTGFLTGLACLTLPETTNAPTAETFEEKKSPRVNITEKEDKI